MSKDEPIERSDRYILSYQLDGLCLALRLMIQFGATPGAKTLQLLTKLRTEVGKNVTGPAMKDVPDIDPHASLPELVAVAEVLRSTLQAFLSPEEVSEKRGPLGFSGRHEY